MSYGTIRESALRAPSRCAIAAPLRELWHTEARGGELPILAHDGRLFLLDTNNRVTAIDGESHDRLWTYPIAGPLQLLHEGRLFIPVARDEIHVVDCATGEPLGTLLSGRADRLLATGRVLIGHGSDYDHGGSRLWALDWQTGQRLWSELLPEDIEVAGIPCANQDCVIYSLESRHRDPAVGWLIARGVDSGEEIWRRDGSQQGLAAIHEDRVVTRVLGRVHAISLRNGETLWQTGEGFCYDGCVYGDRYYVMDEYRVLAARMDQKVRYHVLDLRTGQGTSTWDMQARLPNSLHVRPSVVKLVTETHVFVASSGDALLAFTRDAGEYVWNHKPVGASMGGEVVAVGHRVYYQNGWNKLYCLEARSQ